MWREVWSGVDATEHGVLIYSGATIAPWSADVWSEGWRLRAVAAFGLYRYSGKRGAHGELVPFHGQVTIGEALAGYLWRLGPLTAKAFAGIAAIDHEIAPRDALASNGLQVGPIGGLELWLNLGASAWTSLDLSYTTAHQTYSVHSRLGYRVTPSLSIGIETALNGSAGRTVRDTETDMLDPTHRDVRGGGFLRYEWVGGEVSLSGGLSSDLLERNEPYVTINYLKQF